MATIPFTNQFSAGILAMVSMKKEASLQSWRQNSLQFCSASTKVVLFSKSTMPHILNLKNLNFGDRQRTSPFSAKIRV